MRLQTSRFAYVLLFLLLFSSFSCEAQQQSATKSSIGKQVAEIGEGILVVFQDTKNNFWFAGNAKGVYRYDGKQLFLFSEQDSLCSNAVLGIQEDQAGNLYFDTSKGVSKFDGHTFVTLKVNEKPLTPNEWKLEPNDLWFRMGWDHSGPFRYDGESLHFLELPKTEQSDLFYQKYPTASFNPYGIYSMYKDRKGQLWLGTSSLGVCRYDGTSISWLYEEAMTTIPSGGALGIRSILEDQHGSFWFTHSRYRYQMLVTNAIRNGTNYMDYQRKEGVGYTKPNGEVVYPYFMSIVEDNHGDLWMATYDDGVYRKKGNELLHYPIKDGPKEGLAFSIYKDRQGTLWLTTHNAGLFTFTGSSFEKFKI